MALPRHSFHGNTSGGRGQAPGRLHSVTQLAEEDASDRSPWPRASPAGATLF